MKPIGLTPTSARPGRKTGPLSVLMGRSLPILAAIILAGCSLSDPFGVASELEADQLERRLRQCLDALGPAPRAELLHVLMLPALERRADRRVLELPTEPPSPSS
jgi:hypothetical protein